MSNDDEINPFSREYTARQAGTPQQPQPGPPGQIPGQPVQPTRQRNILVWLIPLLLGMFLMPFFCCGGLLFWGIRGVAAQYAAPGDAAVDAVAADEQVKSVLGEPVEKTGSVSIRNLRIRNDNGSAEVDFNVAGPDGSAHVEGKMKLFAGKWSPEALTITCDDGTVFNLPDTVEVGPGDSF